MPKNFGSAVDINYLFVKYLLQRFVEFVRSFSFKVSQTEASPLPPVMVPVSVLKRFDTTPSGEAKQVLSILLLLIDFEMALMRCSASIH